MQPQLNKLEKLLLTNWTNFINYHQLLEFTNTIVTNVTPNCKINKIKLSRFEMINNGFIIWIEYYGPANGTIEALLTNEQLIFKQHLGS